MTQQNREYPSEVQMKEMWDVLKSGRDAAIPEALRQREQERQEADAEDSDLPEYPTDQQMEEAFNAWKNRGEAGILEFLKKQRQEREQPRDGGPNNHSAQSEATNPVPAPAVKK